MYKLITTLSVLLVCGCATRDVNPQPIRFRFVPGDPASSAPRSRLHPAPDRPGALMAQAHAGVGGTFPIADQDGRELFTVTVVEATDILFVLEARANDASHRIDLPRDKPVVVMIADAEYEFYYPTCYVGPDSSTTTSKAMLLVTRLP